MDGANRRFPQLIMAPCRSPAVRCIRATLSGKVDDLQFAPLRAHISFEESTPSHSLAMQHGSGGAFGGDGIMNPRRFPTVGAALCGTVVLAIWVVGSLAVLGSALQPRGGGVPTQATRA